MLVKCFITLANKATLAYGRAEYSMEGNPSRERGENKVVSERCQNLTGRPQTPGNTQININGLI